MRSLSPETLRARLNGSSEHAVLDVRREGEFARGHLFFACNIPRSILELRIEQLVPRRNTPITIVAKGAYADDVGDVLAHFGYTDVCLLDGEIDGWRAAGGQVFSGINVPSKAFGEYVETRAETPHLGPEELKALLDKKSDIIILDSRPLPEYQVMSIPRAIDCPGAELVYRFFETVPSPHTTVIVNCAGRTRSIIGAQSLIDAGVPNRVMALRDGTMGWHLAGFALDHGKDRHAASPKPMNAGQARAHAEPHAARFGVQTIASIDCSRFTEDAGRTTYVFDVRDPREYALGHRAGAISAPGGQLVQTLDTFVAVHNARIILCDDDGVRAPMTAAWLKQMGVREVFSLTDDNVSTCELSPPPQLSALLRDAPRIALDALRASADTVVLDLASSKEFKSKHIPDARFIERHEVAQQISAFAGKSVVITSPDGRLGRICASEMRGRGLQAAALDGGTMAWAAAGLPLESGHGNLPTQPDDVFYRPYDLTDAAESAMQDYLDWEKGLVPRLGHEPGVRFSRESAV